MMVYPNAHRTAIAGAGVVSYLSSSSRKGISCLRLSGIAGEAEDDVEVEEVAMRDDRVAWNSCRTLCSSVSGSGSASQYCA